MEVITKDPECFDKKSIVSSFEIGRFASKYLGSGPERK
jgi:hypothetical protein